MNARMSGISCRKKRGKMRLMSVNTSGKANGNTSNKGSVEI